MSPQAVISSNFPGAEIVSQGLTDLAADRGSISSDAVAMAATRLRDAGITVPALRAGEPAAHRLYQRLRDEDARTAHSRYNAIVRRVVSFARAAEHARAG